MINNLTKRKIIKTRYNITSVMITADSLRLICVLQVNDEHSIIKQYNMDQSKQSLLHQTKK